METEHLIVKNLGLRRYSATLTYQRELVQARLQHRLRDHLLLVEHYPVVTIGRGGDASQLLVDRTWFKSRGIEIINTDRGGGAAYHGPGQLVAYPIIDLSRHRDIHDYLRRLETVIIKSLKDFDVRGVRLPGFTGVWVNGCKIASIGVKIEKWVTSHGLSLNVANDLTFFQSIRPCGLRDVRSASVLSVNKKAPRMSLVGKSITENFAAVFGYKSTHLGEVGDCHLVRRG